MGAAELWRPVNMALTGQCGWRLELDVRRLVYRELVFPVCLRLGEVRLSRRLRVDVLGVVAISASVRVHGASLEFNSH